ncbi:hypothetical protein D7V78_13545 [Parabacteroides distasonis]|uniref:Uncharacterized protein n=2 Tax=Parabacteroides distasonis TaxID=823 RepID=A0A3L7ZM32_PARDI|nr:hypothetical protein [Parabacteroides distasonis]RLT72876.1 hypothetical protein D7V78_13545 [Parabacteroides distasonis]
MECLMEYQHAVQTKVDRVVESLIKEKERLAKCLLEQLDTSFEKELMPANDLRSPDDFWGSY